LQKTGAGRQHAKGSKDAKRMKQDASELNLASERFSMPSEGAVHAAHDGIITFDEFQRIVMINPAALRMFGCTAEDALGSDFSRFIPARLRADHAAHVRDFTASNQAEKALTGPGSALGLRADGNEFPIEATLSRVDVAGALGAQRFFTAVLRDISKEESLQAELDALKNRFRVVFDLAPIPILISDKDVVVFTNRACEYLFGARNRDQILGQSIYSLLRPESHPAVRRQVSLVLCGASGSTLMSERIVRFDGSVREVEIAVAALPDHGSTTVQMVITDITQRNLERQLMEHSRQELRRLSASVVEAREEERRRIARELHDELGQRLSALKMDLSSLGHDMHRPLYEERSMAMMEMLDETVASVRRIAADLRPMMLDDLGLNAAIEWLARESARRIGLEVTVHLGDVDPPLDCRASTAVYRMVQEALTNVARHAHASDAHIELRQVGHELVLSVQDNGVGFPASATRKEGSFGLMGMRERAYLLGGSLEVDNPPGGGGRITVRLPLQAAAQRARNTQGNAGPPQGSLTPPGGGLGEARPGGRSEASP
jgi:two-component system sensor histidine kinase UhpB